MASVTDTWVSATRSSLETLADPTRAEPMVAYMKGVAPFLGISAVDRRRALRATWRTLPRPEPDDVTTVAVELWALPEREYQYAACDLLAREQKRLPSTVLADPVESLITTKAWWDTVDALGTAIISPVTARDPALVDLMWQWCDSPDRWLIRAAIQHQRGRGEATDVARLLAMCDRHADQREFFIAKAIGWALRDTARWDPDAVRSFLSDHPGMSRVATREAERGLAATR